MNALDLWIHSPGAKALGWTLFHFLWEGAVIAGILVLALAILKHASARTRPAAACMALLGMALAFGITLALEWPWHAARLTIATDPLTGLTLNGGVYTDGGRLPGFRWSEGLAWAPALWMAGVCGLFLYRLGSWMAAQRLRRTGTCPAPEDWQRRLQELVTSVGVSRPVALLESCLAEVPIMIGYLKPVIVVPVGLLMGLPAEQVEAILLHELAHVRRADYLINLVQTAVEGLLFYHPVVWWVSGVVRAERENCCDDAVVQMQGNVHQYAAALLTVEQQRSRVPQTALAASGGSLSRRIRRLLGKPDARDLSLPVLPSTVLLVSMAVALAAWQPAQQQPQTTAPESGPVAGFDKDSFTAPTEDAAPPQAAPQQAAPLPSPAAPQVRNYNVTDQERTAFLRLQSSDTAPFTAEDRVQFLNDTSVIITPQERAAYQKLQTGEEQAKFVEQFWARRNPSPGAATNPFKDEFYRRLAYADDKFSITSGNRTVAGSHTAPGRTYIKYGPPDQIEDHTSDPQNPALLWHYNYVDAFHSNAEFQFAKAGSNYREQINWPPPVATFQGVPTADNNLAAVMNAESRQQGAAVAQSVTPGLPGNHASIQISPEKPMVTLSVPLGSFTGKVDFIAEIRSVSNEGVLGGAVANVRDYLASANGGTWQSQFSLPTGSYVCRLLVRENSTGQMFTEEINFTVQ